MQIIFVCMYVDLRLYNNPHIGNFRPIVIFDILFRLLQNIYDENIVYVRNITDIDDKIINTSND